MHVWENSGKSGSFFEKSLKLRKIQGKYFWANLLYSVFIKLDKRWVFYLFGSTTYILIEGKLVSSVSNDYCIGTKKINYK